MLERIRKDKFHRRKFCGYSWEDMDRLLDDFCWLEDDSMITDREQKAFDIAVQCMVQIMNRMIDGKRIDWD